MKDTTDSSRTGKSRSGAIDCSQAYPADAPSAERGTITLIIGCMFAGKTGALFRLLRRFPEAQRKAFKHWKDLRYLPDSLVSHDGDSLPASRIVRPQEMLDRLLPETRMVALEEVHFFDESLLDVVDTLVRQGRDVALTGLEHDTWGRPIPLVARLRQRADHVEIRHAICSRCGGEADCSHRLTPIIDGNLIGGPESFEPRCRRCWSSPPEPPPPL